MKIIKQNIKIIDNIDSIRIYKKLEKIGRVCYKSENKITNNSYVSFLQKIIDSKHYSILEHESISIHITCDRAISHQIVRHRIASYSQESQIYCNYKNNKFSNNITYILPYQFYLIIDNINMIDTIYLNFKYKKIINPIIQEFIVWYETCNLIEETYLNLIDKNTKAGFARNILINSVKTELIMTMNLRMWRHFITTRITKDNHIQIIEITTLINNELKKQLPIIFNNIEKENE